MWSLMARPGGVDTRHLRTGPNVIKSAFPLRDFKFVSPHLKNACDIKSAHLIFKSLNADK
jgi:hypothetical protein